jgi:hypothetical protein
MIQKINSKIIEIFRRILFKIFKHYYESKYLYGKGIPTFEIKNKIEKDLRLFIFKDETWNYVKNIHKIFKYKSLGIKLKCEDNVCENNKLLFINNNSFLVNSIGGVGAHDDWVYLYSKESFPENYFLEFITTIYSGFTEFQIAFCHKDITERYRFRVVDNSYLSFEIVKNGFFFNDFRSVPFSFQVGKSYKIKIVIYKHIYCFFCEDKLLLRIDNNAKNILTGGVAFIFWDNKERSNIKLKLENISFYNIV